MRWTDKAYHLIEAVDSKISDLGGMMIPLTVIAIIFDVTTRNMGIYVRKFSAEELSGYALVITIFLTVGYTMRRGKHIRIDAFINRFPPRIQDFIFMLSYILCLIYASVIAVTGIGFTAHAFQLQIKAVSASEVIIWPITAFIVLGAFVLWFESVLLLWKLIATLISKRKKPLIKAGSGSR